MADREGYWITPKGKSIPIHEHVMYMIAHPKPFGLTAKQVEALPELVQVPGQREEALLFAIRNGWIRVRGYGTYTSFDVWTLDEDAIFRIWKHLRKTKTWENERVTVYEHRYKKMYDDTAGDYFSGAIAQYARNPRKSRRRGK